jgi:hypothetical protein
MNRIDELLTQLENNIPHCETARVEVSEGAVGWHIEHCLLIVNKVTDSLIQSDPKDYKWKFSFIRIMVLNLKKIPRGKAKAPKAVQPKDNIDKSELEIHLSKTRNSIKELEFLSNDKYFKHPFFGNLKLKQTINFLEIHTNHHLKIIEDIIKK